MLNPQDDKTIKNDDRVIRVITKHHLCPDDNTGGKRIASSAYSPSTRPRGGMSVDLEAEIIADNKKPSDIAKQKKGFLGAVAIEVADVRDTELIVARTPTEENPYHGEVYGGGGARPTYFSKGQSRELAKKAVWLAPIPNVQIK